MKPELVLEPSTKFYHSLRRVCRPGLGTTWFCWFIILKIVGSLCFWTSCSSETEILRNGPSRTRRHGSLQTSSLFRTTSRNQLCGKPSRAAETTRKHGRAVRQAVMSNICSRPSVFVLNMWYLPGWFTHHTPSEWKVRWKCFYLYNHWCCCFVCLESKSTELTLFVCLFITQRETFLELIKLLVWNKKDSDFYFPTFFYRPATGPRLLLLLLLSA